MLITLIARGTHGRRCDRRFSTPRFSVLIQLYMGFLARTLQAIVRCSAPQYLFVLLVVSNYKSSPLKNWTPRILREYSEDHRYHMRILVGNLIILGEITLNLWTSSTQRIFSPAHLLLNGVGTGFYNDTKCSYYVEAQFGSRPSVKEEPKWALNTDWCGGADLAPSSPRLALAEKPKFPYLWDLGWLY